MTPRERRIRIEVGFQVIENAVLDYLAKQPQRVKTSAVSKDLGINSNALTGKVLNRFRDRGSVDDVRDGLGAHWWRIKPTTMNGGGC